MAALTTRLPVVTTSGELTERVWAESGGVALVPARDPAAMGQAVASLAADGRARVELGARGRRLYDERFALPVTVARIRRA
jgi:glycosyltransferase involved in cell wall biosynthesis